VRLPVHENTIADILLQIYTNKTKSEQKEEIFAKKNFIKKTFYFLREKGLFHQELLSVLNDDSM